LFAEDELRISGRMRGTGPAKFIIRGKLAGKKVEFTRSVDLGKSPARAWTAPLWAQSRIDHLLEEISLDGSKQEMKDEVLELALAYNFVTPYTAFLAVPESELGAMANTVAQARERKHKIMADNPDVAGLDKNAGSTGGQVVAQAQITQTTTQNVPVRHMAPRESIDLRGADDGDDDHDSAPRHDGKRVAKADSDDDEARGSSPTAPTAEKLSTSRAHGCAGCAMTGGDGGLLLVGLTAMLLRRRRRAR
jgi:MYXO-CTERM domain-containing protein